MKPGIKIAQMVIQLISSENLFILASSLNTTAGGKRGFGSTGIQTQQAEKETTLVPSTTHSLVSTLSPRFPPPLVHSIDTVSSALPQRTVISDLDLKKSVGYCQMELMHKKHRELYEDTV